LGVFDRLFSQPPTRNRGSVVDLIFLQWNQEPAAALALSKTRVFCMPLFYFILKDGRNSLPDRDGIELPSAAAAHSHGNAVARELMRNRESKTRSWRLQVCDDDLQPVLELPFAQLDDSLSHLPPESRQAIQKVCHNMGLLSDSICNVRTTLEQIRATISRANEIVLNSPLQGSQTSRS
jgi:hypothetical protein